MKIKEVYRDESESVFIIEAPHYLVNSIRRVMLEDVKTCRIDTVKIYKNVSHLYDEVLAHRLGLLVVKVLDENVDLENVVLKLKKKGNCMVRAKDIEIPKEYSNKIKILYEETPIVYLDNENQEIDLELKLKWGSGKEHIKYKPAHVWFKYYPIVEVKEGVSAKDLNERIGFELFSEKGGNVEISMENIIKYDISSLLIDLEDIVKIKEDKNKIIFYIDNFGDFDNEELFKKAINILIEKYNEFKNKISQMKDG